MSNSKKCTLWDLVQNTNPQYFCLAAALALEALLMAFRGYGFYFVENYMIVPAMLFLGMAFGKKLSSTSRWQLWLSLGFVFWFFIAQTLHYMMDMEVRSLGLFTAIYLFAFPFASLTGDGQKQFGLKMAAIAYIAAALVLVGLTALLALDLLPGFLAPHVYWDGARLLAMWHPNICAIIFMIGITFCLFFSVQARKKWIKGLCIATAVVLFFVMALTNSRTSIMMCCCIIGGFLFFAIYNGSWKRFAAGALAALVTIAVLFFSAQSIFKLHNNLLVTKYLQEAGVSATYHVPASEEHTSPLSSSSSFSQKQTVVVDRQTGELTLKGEAGQQSLAENLPTLNGRTHIWNACIQIVKSNPRIMLLGLDHSEEVLTTYRNFSTAHAHNAWLETLMCLGIPGLLFSLVFTVIAVWHIWVICWDKNCCLSKKAVALLLLCLMGAGMLEPYLFFSDIFYHYTDFIFFLCLGYLIQWRIEARK